MGLFCMRREGHGDEWVRSKGFRNRVRVEWLELLGWDGCGWSGMEGYKVVRGFSGFVEGWTKRGKWSVGGH